MTRPTPAVMDKTAEYIGHVRFYRKFEAALKAERLEKEVITQRSVSSVEWDRHMEHSDRSYLQGPFAAELGRYMIVSVEALHVKNAQGFIKKDYASAVEILNGGLPVPGTGPDGETRKWYSYMYWFSDETLYMVMVEDRLTAYRTFDRAGLLVSLNKSGDEFKVNKYLKRACAHHQDMWFGRVLSQAKDESHFLVDINRRKGNRFLDVALKIAHREPTEEKLGGEIAYKDDGISLITLRAMLNLYGGGAFIAVGQIIVITVMTPWGLFKGHCLIVPDEQLTFADMLLIGAKKLIRTKGDNFSFGILRTIEGPKPANTDAQSAQNFELEEFLPTWAAHNFLGIRQESENEDTVQAAVQGSLKRDVIRRKDKDNNLIELPATAENDNWLITKVMRRNKENGLGVRITRTPALRRAADRLYAETIAAMHMEDRQRRIRIGIPFDVARAVYIIVDPTAFDPTTGKIKKGGGVLKGKQMYMNGLSGPCAAHRNPNGCRDEIVPGNLVGDIPELAAYKNAPVLIVSAAFIARALQILGGGDQDDRVVVYTDVTVVKHIQSLRPYKACARPEEAKAVVVERMKVPYDPFGAPVPPFSREVLKGVMSASLSQDITLGQVINMVMVYNELEKANRLDGIYDFSWVAKSTEEIIDALIRGLKIEWLKKSMNDMRVSLKDRQIAYWTLGRLSRGSREKYNITGCQSKMDSVLGVISRYSDEWRRMCAEREHWIINDWDNYPVAQTMAAYSLGPDVHALASEMADLYKAVFQDQRAALPGTAKYAEASEPVIGGAASRMAQRAVYDRYKDHPLVNAAMIALWQLVYSADSRAHRRQNGWGVGDAILWGVSEDGRGTADLTLNAIHWAGHNPPVFNGFNPQDDQPVVEEYEPTPKVDLEILLVNGMAKETDEIVDAWYNQVADDVIDLEPTEWNGIPAVRVHHTNCEHSWVSRESLPALLARMKGEKIQAIVVGRRGRNAIRAVVI